MTRFKPTLLGALAFGWAAIGAPAIAEVDGSPASQRAAALMASSLSPGMPRSAAEARIEGVGATCHHKRHASGEEVCVFRDAGTFDGDLLVVVDWTVRLRIDDRDDVAGVIVRRSLDLH